MFYYSLLKADKLGEGECIEIKGMKYIKKKKIIGQQSIYSGNQQKNYYLGADISHAVDVAREHFTDQNIFAEFIQIEEAGTQVVA
jgi:hypothetical protein